MRRVAFSGLSDGPGGDWEEKEKALTAFFSGMDILPIQDPLLQRKDRQLIPAKERAAFVNAQVQEGAKVIMDVTGGNGALEALPYLDLEAIKNWDGLFFGYSDLTCILNALTYRTGRPTVLYQGKNLLGEGEEGEARREAFRASFLEGGPWPSLQEGGKSLFSFPYEMIRGEGMEGVAAGGNLRCLLKLAGTAFWPCLKGRVLVLEALGGDGFAIGSCLMQLSLMGVFSQVNGIVLGTFTQLDREEGRERIWDLLLPLLPPGLPVARTSLIGHGRDSRAVLIGKRICLAKGKVEVEGY